MKTFDIPGTNGSGRNITKYPWPVESLEDAAGCYSETEVTRQRMLCASWSTDWRHWTGRTSWSVAAKESNAHRSAGFAVSNLSDMGEGSSTCYSAVDISSDWSREDWSERNLLLCGICCLYVFANE